MHTLSEEFYPTELWRGRASLETIDLRTLEFGPDKLRSASTTSERVTHLHIPVPAITPGTLARTHELKMTGKPQNHVRILIYWMWAIIAQIMEGVFLTRGVHTHSSPWFFHTFSVIRQCQNYRKCMEILRFSKNWSGTSLLSRISVLFLWTRKLLFSKWKHQICEFRKK